MHLAAFSSQAAHRRVTRAGAGAGLRALARVVTMTTAQGVVIALPPRSPGPGLS